MIHGNSVPKGVFFLFLSFCLLVFCKRQKVNSFGFAGNTIFVITIVIGYLMMGYILRNMLLGIFVVEGHKRQYTAPGGEVPH